MKPSPHFSPAQHGHITPFGLWLLGWLPRFRRYGSFDMVRGWQLGFANGWNVAFFAARPDYDIWGRQLIFWGHLCVLGIGWARLRWWRGAVIVRPLEHVR